MSKIKKARIRRVPHSLTRYIEPKALNMNYKFTQGQNKIKKAITHLFSKIPIKQKVFSFKQPLIANYKKNPERKQHVQMN